ncbi:MAG TPA: SRPBCC domain-containing protein [Longimicrobiales bacterium]|nr:SRPBCC domain-containing protein [Longimicrobiales bacterium]
MERLEFSITIAAPREAVWNALLGDATYRVWTAPFAEGSHFIGDWSEGSRILFLAPYEGRVVGMIGRIAKNRPFEQITIEQLGTYDNGVEDTTSDEVREWSGALEEYTLRTVDGGTEVHIAVDVLPSDRERMEAVWPEALRALKSLVEA